VRREGSLRREAGDVGDIGGLFGSKEDAIWNLNIVYQFRIML
jgi:hypothetical protein